ncbi:MAG: DnaA/Hda family protein [Deltaproteobacteria bacterium]|nr:DnaA/Hda family protein [Deltaproteobacteria bacterium]
MTFSNYIAGNSNSMARAMALYVSENPAGSYNPCYIYGGRGTGKSHLINAIANELAQKDLDLFIGRLSTKEEETEPMGSCKVVIIDDFPFAVDERERTLADFVKGGGQLILTGALSPDSFPASPLAELIKKEGKSADIPPPEEELKVAILKARADEENIKLPDDVAHFIAGHMGGNINSLLGALKRVRAHASLEGKGINRFTAIESLKDYIWIEEGQL